MFLHSFWDLFEGASGLQSFWDLHEGASGFTIVPNIYYSLSFDFEGLHVEKNRSGGHEVHLHTQIYAPNA